jgi:anti-sigma factor RsiW
MNDLKQNELFSAYLDGELNADEQAEMERLLATSPAAWQLLDELRALSTTLQSLPQEKLGEDLGPAVLRVAERRMLTGREHDIADNAPVPLVKSALRHIFNRRGLAWAGLAVAIAVMFSFNEWWQQSRSLTPAAHEIARVSSARDQKVVPKSVEPHMIQTEDGRKDVLREESEKPADVELQTTLKNGVGSESLRSAPAPSALDMPATIAFDRSSKSEVVPAEEKAGAGSAPVVSAPSLAAPSEEKLDEAMQRAKASTLAGEAADVGEETNQPEISFDVSGAEQVEKRGIQAGGITVIRCDISPKAAERRSFEKLLDANGMTWREQVDRERIAEKAAEKGTKKKAAEPSSSLSKASDEVDLVWVVATPAQIDATLAGLAAQPNVFLTYSVNPPTNELPDDVVQQFLATGRTLRQLVPGSDLFQFEQRTKVAGPAMEPGTVGQLEMDVRKVKQPSTRSGQRSDASVVKSGEKKPSAGSRMGANRSAEPASMQRVLFVLRVVGRATPAENSAAPAKQPAQAK